MITGNRVEPFIRAYAAIARPMILHYFPEPNACIAACRTTLECLKRFGVRSRVEAVELVVTVPDLELSYVSGLSVESKQRAIDKSKELLSVENATDAWDGHVVVIADGYWLIDPTFDAPFAAMYQAGKLKERLEPAVSFVKTESPMRDAGWYMKIGVGFSDGTMVDVQYNSRPEYRSFTKTPAWEIDHLQPLIHSICEGMKQAMKNPIAGFSFAQETQHAEG